MSEAFVFTDGASRGNPGESGWGAVVALPDTVQELGARIELGTNNQAELSAVVEAISWIDDQDQAIDRVHIYSDSKYTISGAESWIFGWQKRGWKTKTGDPVKNQELWQEFSQVREEVDFDITFHKVKGHASIPGNERADDIATAFADDTPPELYSGERQTYAVSLDPKPAYLEKSPLYFSLIGDVAHQHDTWDECKRRVTGHSAKYRKVRTVSERDELLNDWGVDLEDVES
jgi:ribonuclease HI